MPLLRSLLRLQRTSIVNGNVEDSCLELLRADPTDLLATQILASHYWREEKYELAHRYSIQALGNDVSNREMLLIAAGSAYRLGESDLARKYAEAAVHAPPVSTSELLLMKSRCFRALKRLPALQGHLASLETELHSSSDHYNELLSWATEFLLWQNKQNKGPGTQ